MKRRRHLNQVCMDAQSSRNRIGRTSQRGVRCETSRIDIGSRRARRTKNATGVTVIDNVGIGDLRNRGLRRSREETNRRQYGVVPNRERLEIDWRRRYGIVSMAIRIRTNGTVDRKQRSCSPVSNDPCAVRYGSTRVIQIVATDRRCGPDVPYAEGQETQRQETAAFQEVLRVWNDMPHDRGLCRKSIAMP